MCKYKLTFRETGDHTFMVTAEASVSALASNPQPIEDPAIYKDENAFLVLVIDADLGVTDATRVISTVLLTLGRPSTAPPWVDVDLTVEQLGILGLRKAASPPFRHYEREE